MEVRKDQQRQKQPRPVLNHQQVALVAARPAGTNPSDHSISSHDIYLCGYLQENYCSFKADIRMVLLNIKSFLFNHTLNHLLQ